MTPFLLQSAVRPLLVALLAVTGAAHAAERTNIVSASKLAESWVPAPGSTPAAPAYPAIIADKSEAACVTIGFLIKPDGSTDGASLLKSWSGNHGDDNSNREFIDPFARNALAAVRLWKFVPAKARPRQAYTSASFAFSTDANADQAALRARCEIGNLPAFIAKVQSDAYRRGNLTKGELDRDRIKMTTPPARGAKIQ